MCPKKKLKSTTFLAEFLQTAAKLCDYWHNDQKHWHFWLQIVISFSVSPVLCDAFTW